MTLWIECISSHFACSAFGGQRYVCVAHGMYLYPSIYLWQKQNVSVCRPHFEIVVKHSGRSVARNVLNTLTIDTVLLLLDHLSREKKLFELPPARAEIAEISEAARWISRFGVENRQLAISIWKFWKKFLPIFQWQRGAEQQRITKVFETFLLGFCSISSKMCLFYGIVLNLNALKCEIFCHRGHFLQTKQSNSFSTFWLWNKIHFGETKTS